VERINHNELVNYLFNRPYELGVNPKLILAKNIEHQLYLEGELFVTPDIHILTPDRQLFYEIKSANNETCIRAGLLQATKMHRWLEHYKQKGEVYIVMPRHHHLYRLNHLQELLRIRRS